MSWQARHRVRRYFRESVFLLPGAAIVAAFVVAPVVRAVDARTHWTLLGFTSSGASALLSALASSLFALVVFTFSILLLAVQIAGGQLSPRIIARVFSAPKLKAGLALFTFSFTYVLAALSRVEDRVPQLPVFAAVLASFASLGVFLYLVQRIGEEFRPGTVMTRIAERTRAVLDEMYPLPFVPSADEHAALALDRSRADRVVVQRKGCGVVLAFDVAGLLALAERAGVTIELVPQVGDFLAEGDPLFRLYGTAAAVPSEEDLRACVALGIERTLEQDPAFGFRIIVDVASKALSPAINDPTTGVLAVDQLHQLLALVAGRRLDTGVVRGASGDVRLVYRTPDWEDFVTLAATEVRIYGATNPQVTRRLRAMYDQLLRVVPEERKHALRREVALLDGTIEKAWPSADDRAIAAASDSQGFGGRARAN